MGWKLVLFGSVTALLALGGVYVYTRPSSIPKSYPHFSHFMQKYSRKYPNPQIMEQKIAIFRKNMLYIEDFNSRSKMYKLGVNKFADLSFTEFRKTYLMVSIHKSTPMIPRAPFAYLEPLEKNWEKEGKVTPIKDQGEYPNGWAFAAVGAMESSNGIYVGKLTNYSEQELIDCLLRNYYASFDDFPVKHSYAYITKNRIAFSRDYPYIGRKLKCEVKLDKRRDGIRGYESLEKIYAEELVKLVDVSPVALPIQVQKDFVFYKGGIFTADAECGKRLNHQVLAVGYKIIKDRKYFILKNSWGESWGEKGYMRIDFGYLNTGICGMINEKAIIPVPQSSQLPLANI